VRGRREGPGAEELPRGHRELEHAGDLRDLRRYREALEAYRRLLAEDSSSSAALEEIAAIAEAQEEAAREEELARQELGRGDLETAIWRLERLHGEFPDRRQSVAPVLARARILKGHALAARSLWSEAAASFLAATIDPEQVDEARQPLVAAIANQVAPLLERGEFGAIEPLARQGLEVDPTSPLLRYYLGLALEARGRSLEAAQAYLAAGGGKRPRGAEHALTALRRQAEQRLQELHGQPAASVLSLLREVLPGDFRKIATPHFVVLHRNTALGQEVARLAESEYEQLFRALGCQTHWRAPCEIIIFPSREEYLKEAGVGAWSGAAHQLGRRRGDLSEHRILSFQEQPRLTSGLLAHEIAHALLVHRLNYPAEVPLWANEGFAVHAEPGYRHRHYRSLVLEAKRRQALLPLRRVVSLAAYPDGEALELFYAQAFTLVELLIEKRGITVFVSFLKDISRPAAWLDAALERHYGIPSLTALESAWLAGR
jgi:tetratricopeptide (TPR) repeat protein